MYFTIMSRRPQLLLLRSRVRHSVTARLGRVIDIRGEDKAPEENDSEGMQQESKNKATGIGAETYS